MEQHPVPQNISSYEFRLVGDMTLKQFFMLAAGVIVGIIFFQLPIPGIFKYPMTGLSVLVGVLSAFVPFQGRPFYLWVIAFFRAIYSSTEYVWVPTPPAAPPTVTATLAPTVIPQSQSQSQVFTGFLSFLSSLFAPKKSATSPLPPVTPSPSPLPPVTPPPLPSRPSPTPFKLPVSVAVPHITITPTSPPPQTSQPTITTYATVSAPPPRPPPPAAPAPVKAPPPPIAPAAPGNTGSFSGPLRTAGPFPGLPKINPPSTPPPTATVATPATPIAPPTTSNILAGLVADSLNQAITGATVEIIDSHTGIPARALRTNRLGQFQIAIPLPAGAYIINAEKSGFTFEPVSVHVANALIPPIIIKAQT